MTPEDIQEDLIIERYLADKLDSAEAEEFEARLLWDKALQEDFELTRRLRASIRRLQQPPEVVDNNQRTGPASWQPSRLAFAASIFVAIGAGALISQLTMQPAATDPVAIAEVYRLDLVRSLPGTDNLPVISPDNGDNLITLLASPNSNGRDTFRAELSLLQEDGSWASVWQGKPVSGLRDNTLGVHIRGDILAAGTYRLTVQGWSGQNPPTVASEDFFRVPAR